jgi:hypothetical protein
VVSFTPRSLYLPGKKPVTPWIRICVSPRDRLEAVEKKNISYHGRESNPDFSVVHPVYGIS